MDRLFTILLLSAVFLAGCRGTRDAALDRPALPAGFPNHTATEIRSAMAASAVGLTSVSARVVVSATTRLESGRFSGDLRLQRDDSLYLSLSPGLGIEAARALVTPDSVFILNRIQNELMVGSIEEAGAYLPVPLDVQDRMGALLGFAPPEADEPLHVSADGNIYVVRDAEGLRSWTIDPTIWRVLRYEEVNGMGERVELREYQDYEAQEGLFLPERVVFDRPEDGVRASMTLRSVDTNPETLSFDLRASKSARRVPLDR